MFTTGSVTKAMPIQFIDGKSHIKKQRSHKTALYPVITQDFHVTCLGDGHTHIHQRSRTKRFQETKCARAGDPHTPGLKNSFENPTNNVQ